MRVEHKYGETSVPAPPERVVVVGLTEQDILLELGIVPVATTEWYGNQPNAVWPWAASLLGEAKPTVLSTMDGLEFEKIATLQPDLIIGTNAGLTQEDYTKLSQIAPTITSVEGSPAFFSDWKAQTRQVAKAVGKSAEGDQLVQDVEAAYQEAASAHPELKGLTATFSQGSPYDGNLYVYPDGVNTDFLTDLGLVITPGLEKYVPADGAQAKISSENIDLIDADVIVFATNAPDTLKKLLTFGTVAQLDAVVEKRAVYTDAILAGAIYFLTPLSQKYVLDKLIPRLSLAAAGESPQSIDQP